MKDGQQVRSLEFLFPRVERYALQIQQAQPKQKMPTNLAFLAGGICTRRIIQIGTDRRQKSETKGLPPISVYDKISWMVRNMTYRN